MYYFNIITILLIISRSSRQIQAGEVDNYQVKPIKINGLFLSNSIQEIRKKEKAEDKKIWGKKPQIVKLPVKCEGPPKNTNIA